MYGIVLARCSITRRTISASTARSVLKAIGCRGLRPRPRGACYTGASGTRNLVSRCRFWPNRMTPRAYNDIARLAVKWLSWSEWPRIKGEAYSRQKRNGKQKEKCYDCGLRMRLLGKCKRKSRYKVSHRQLQSHLGFPLMSSAGRLLVLSQKCPNGVGIFSVSYFID